jgi:HEAT repeat protein
MRIDALVSLLASLDGCERQNARLALVAIGKPASPALVKALVDERARVRWEAAKALVDIADSAAVPALLGALEDDRSGIRWLAAQALIALDRECLKSLLEILIERPSSVRIRDAVHHICHEHAAGPLGEALGPVLDALDHSDPVEMAPPAAFKALKLLEE